MLPVFCFEIEFQQAYTSKEESCCKIASRRLRPFHGSAPAVVPLDRMLRLLSVRRRAMHKGGFIPPDPNGIRLSVLNVVYGTTLHTSVRFQRSYGCYAIHPLEGSDCRVANYRHRQSLTRHL